MQTILNWNKKYIYPYFRPKSLDYGYNYINSIEDVNREIDLYNNSIANYKCIINSNWIFNNIYTVLAFDSAYNIYSDSNRKINYISLSLCTFISLYTFVSKYNLNNVCNELLHIRDALCDLRDFKINKYTEILDCLCDDNYEIKNFDYIIEKIDEVNLCDLNNYDQVSSINYDQVSSINFLGNNENLEDNVNNINTTHKTTKNKSFFSTIIEKDTTIDILNDTIETLKNEIKELKKVLEKKIDIGVTI